MTGGVVGRGCAGELREDWDFLPPKKIKDPATGQKYWDVEGAVAWMRGLDDEDFRPYFAHDAIEHFFF